MTAVCDLCPHACRLREDETGFCRARTNVGGVIRPTNYGRLTALALDPIEKKPLYHFHPGHAILSVGSYGCNLACPFCQNADIAAADAAIPTENVPPARLAALAQELSAAPHGSLGVAFTYNEPLISYEYIMDTAPLLHAAGLAVVLVEVTTLIIPGENDSLADMDAEARWLAALSPDLPLHISRYFPRHRLHTPPTPIAAIDALTAAAARHLRYVHRGNC